MAEGHRLVPEAAETVRGDSFVPATNIHYPTDSSLIGDGLRTIVPLAVRLARLLGLGGWRQRKHLLRTVLRFTGVVAGAVLRLVRNLVAWRRSLDIPGWFSMQSIERQTFERSNDWFPAFEETHGDRFG